MILFSFVTSFENLKNTFPPTHGSMVAILGNHWVNRSGFIRAEYTLSTDALITISFLIKL